MVLLEIENYRTGFYTYDVGNYVDNILIHPQSPDFIAGQREISASMGGLCHFALDAGPAFAGKEYLILSGVTGSYPGFDLSKVHVHLNPDAWTWAAFTLINTPVMMGFMGKLNSTGQATAALHALVVPPEAVGLAMYFDYLVLANPGAPPLEKASHPVYVLFIP